MRPELYTTQPISMQTKLGIFGGFLVVAFFVLLIISSFSTKPKLLHRYWSIVLCLSWGFLYPVLREFCPFWGIGLLCACIIYLARHLWIVDERRHRKNEELWAVLSSNNFETVKSYLTTKPNLEVTDREQRSPIEIALQNNNEKIAELLLLHGAKFTHKEFFLAISKNYIKVVNIMLEKGIDVNFYNESLKRPLECAIENNCVEITKNLLLKGAAWKSLDLFSSVSNKRVQITNMLLDKGAYSDDALFYAVQNNLIDTAKHIINNMIDANIDISNFSALLTCAIQNNHLEIASMLLKGGAYDQDALVLAIQKDLTDITNHIIENIPATRNLLDIINALIEKKCEGKYIMMLLGKITEEDLLNKNYNESINILLAAMQNDYCDVAQWLVKHKIYNRETRLLAMKKGYTHLMEQMMK